MICPRCSSAMSERNLGPVAVDSCEGGCGGLWFDWGELSRIDEPGEGVGAALDAALQQNPLPPRLSRISCTRCGIPTQEHRYKGVPQVLIDECYGCRGFFLDPGELRGIREWLGEQRGKGERVERLLGDIPGFRRRQIEAALERDRVEILEKVSKILTEKFLGVPLP